MFDDFGFEDIDAGVDMDDMDNIESSDFEDLNDTEYQQDPLEDKQAVVKTATTAIVLGILIVIAAFLVMRLIRGGKQIVEEYTGEELEDNIEVVEDIGEPVEDIKVNREEWVEFTDNGEITFENKRVDSIFVVTNIKQYVKIIESEKKLFIKTVLSGRVDGFSGVYEIEIPYSKGKMVSVGDEFKVTVQVGKFKGYEVIGEIKY